MDAEPANDAVERRLDAYDRRIRGRQEDLRQREAARRQLDRDFAALRAEILEPAILAVRDALVEHGHRVEIEELEHVSAAPDIDTPARVSLTILPDGWDLEGDRYRFRPRLTFEAGGDGTVRLHYWLARPGEPARGGLRARVPVAGLTRERVDQELQAFIDAVFSE